MLGFLFAFFVGVTIMYIIFKVDPRRIGRYEAGGDFKEEFSPIDYCLKFFNGNYIKLKNVSFSDNLEFTTIDTILLHSTGIYIF